ncbi:MAG: GIY-YIG nuclease family protein [Deltaproteobacteria bacterium]|nr:GIY-YIG nuclease family protein [Deltaproteobacteria bacterium]MBI2974580.1 GIY-YIG nuclease family protein [Deltaproteobacteria bacterium]
MKKTWYLYILECSDKSLYTGVTNNLAARFAKHLTGRGAKYTRRGVRKIVHTETFKSMSAALKREHTVKKLPRRGKLALIS